MSALIRVKCIPEAGLAPCFCWGTEQIPRQSTLSLPRSFAGLDARATAIKPRAGPELDVQLSRQKSPKERER